MLSPKIFSLRVRDTTRSKKSFSCAEGGVAAIEFAFVAPIFLSILMGVFEFGLIIYSYNNALHVSRDAARQLATNRIAATDAPTIIKSSLPPWLSKNSNLTVNVAQTTPGTQSSNIFSVTITFPASAATPVKFLSSFYSALSLTAKTSMQQERKA